MLPTLFHVGSVPVPTHDALIALGASVGAVVFLVLAERDGAGRDPRLTVIAFGAMLSGAIFAKASTGWRWLQQTDDATLMGLWLHGGRSILGGLAGAYVGVLVTKRIVGYRRSTGDHFAPAVAVAMAIGRVGCFLTEPIGRPTSLPWGITVDPALATRIPACPHCASGVAMHPAFLYEIGFHLLMFGVLLWLRPRIDVPGELFKIWLLAYGVFRLVNEEVRVNPEYLGGLTGSQVFLLLTLPLLAAYFVRQLRVGAYGRPAGRPLAVGP